MAFKDGEWIMTGYAWDDPRRIRTWQEMISFIEKIGFLPLFANEISGFSAEEHVSPRFWWTGDPENDPWEWREFIAASHQVAYGKFFGGKAGFISRKWLPFFVNYRRDGYDFDSRWEDGLASRRERLIMERLTGRDRDGDMTFPDIRILSTDLKKEAGFCKGGEKNFPGITTGLQMQMYLVITGFCRRKNKSGSEYGMPVSVLQPPETIWGYETVTAAYEEEPDVSRGKIISHVKELLPGAYDKDIVRLVGKPHKP